MRGERVEPSARGAFAAGILTVLFVLLLFGAFLALRVGTPRLVSRIRDTVMAATGPKHQRVLDLPGDVHEELVRAGAVIDNAGRGLVASSLVSGHDTVLVHGHPDFGWLLRPGVELEGFVLKARNPVNLDPPVLYLPAAAPVGPVLARFLAERVRVHYRFTTDAEGRRRTVPAVGSERAILVVGDSVAFGVGVADDATVASELQRIVGPELRVLNAGVGGYSGEQALACADALSRERRFEGLVYLTSQNDFMLDAGEHYGARADRVLAGFARLRERFSGRVAVLVVSYLEFAARDLFLDEGRPPDELVRTEELYGALPDLARRHGVAYVDWRALVGSEARANGSIFATPALYADHGHLSPRGSWIAARELHAALADAGGASVALAPVESDYASKRSAVGEPAAFSSSSITFPNGSRP
jgi:hypothetical protein